MGGERGSSIKEEVLEEEANDENEDWGVNCLFQTCTLMTFNKNNKPVTSASQFSIYVQNVRSLGTIVTSRKFPRPSTQVVTFTFLWKLESQNSSFVNYGQILRSECRLCNFTIQTV